MDPWTRNCYFKILSCCLLVRNITSQGVYTIWCDDMSNYSSTGWSGNYLQTTTSQYCSSAPCLHVYDAPSTATKLNINASIYSHIYLSYDIRWTNPLDGGEYISVWYSCNGDIPTSDNTITTYYGANNVILSPIWNLTSISGGVCDFASSISVSFRMQASIEYYFLDNVCLTADHIPTVAPTLQPTMNPTLRPTIKSEFYPLQYINNLNASCNDLVDNMGIEYDGTLFNCSNWCDHTHRCKMFNYFENFKTVNDSRCYIFDHVCDIKIENTIHESTIGYYGFETTCLNYPYDWVDITGDDCNFYTSYKWCNNSSIQKNENDFLSYVDNKYQRTAIEVCCDCNIDVGISSMDEVEFSLDINWVDFENDIVCQWSGNDHEFTANKTILRDWNNMILYDVCNDMQDIDCNIFIDTELDIYSLHLCEYNIMDYKNNFQFIFDIGIGAEYDIYVNSLWFNFDSSYYSNIHATHLNYSECVTDIIDSNDTNKTFYGAHPCRIMDILSVPTQQPISPSESKLEQYTPQYINHINDSTTMLRCYNLYENIGLEYDINLSNCTSWCNNISDCKMFNYLDNFKEFNHSRCYIFNELCNIKSENIDQVNYQSVIGYYEFKKECFNYPFDWVDNVGDDCNYYTSYNWCKEQTILRDENNFYNLIDDVYKLSAIDTCCECDINGGINIMDGVAFDTSLIDYQSDVLCAWTDTDFTVNKQHLRSWDNIVLYNMCINLEDIDCNFLIDTLFNHDDVVYSLYVCDYHAMYQNHSRFEFIFDVAITNKSQIFYDIYINTLWLNLSLTHYSSSINIMYRNYSECVADIINTNINTTKHYGVHPCYVLDTLPPTSAPTLSPSQSPTMYPTNYPTPSPTRVQKLSCGSFTWCYYADIYPQIGHSTVQNITIQNTNDNQNTYFLIYITPIGNDCVDPTITFITEEIDFAGSDEYINIYDGYYDSTLISHCTGTLDNNCGNWLQCLNNFPLATDRLIQGINHTFTIFESAEIDDVCSPWSINAVFTLTCSGATKSPTTIPTNNPTNSPSAPPTLAPTTSPTGIPIFMPTHPPTPIPTNIPTTPTSNPSKQPTNVPTDIPTNNPTYPTVIPTSSPSNEPTNVPTTDIPTNDPTFNPSEQPNNRTTPISTLISDGNSDNNGEQTLTLKAFTQAIIIILSMMLALFCIILFIVLLYKKKDNKNELPQIGIQIEKIIKTEMKNYKYDIAHIDEEKNAIGDDTIGFCIICCDNKADMFNDPCGHVSFCHNCAENALLNDGNKCPICRQRIQSKRLYNASFRR